jgi:hypothetical protein
LLPFLLLEPLSVEFNVLRPQPESRAYFHFGTFSLLAKLVQVFFLSGLLPSFFNFFSGFHSRREKIAGQRLLQNVKKRQRKRRIDGAFSDCLFGGGLQGYGKMKNKKAAHKNEFIHDRLENLQNVGT